MIFFRLASIKTILIFVAFSAVIVAFSAVEGRPFIGQGNRGVEGAGTGETSVIASPGVNRGGCNGRCEVVTSLGDCALDMRCIMESCRERGGGAGGRAGRDLTLP